jgi:hypothetical protein
MARHDETPLEQAERHLAIGESLVAEQRAIIERLRSEGRPTLDAQRLLATLEESLRLMHEHLAYERSHPR